MLPTLKSACIVPSHVVAASSIQIEWNVVENVLGIIGMIHYLA
jgi:hypothetical protein